jgi:hypothetical protein
MRWNKPVVTGRGGKLMSIGGIAEYQDGLFTREIGHAVDMLVTGMFCPSPIANEEEFTRCRNHCRATCFTIDI